MVKPANEKAALKPVQGDALLRERESHADWFAVEFLVYYERSQIRTFAYVRRKDGGDIPDGEYDLREGEDEGRRKWKKWRGEWQVKWRHRWSRKGQ